MLYAGSNGAYLGDLDAGLNNPAYIADTESLITRSDGGTASFQIVLRSQPSADVVFTLTVSRPNQGTLSATTLTFTSANWNLPQTVTVTGLDDGIANGDQTYQITATVTSSDANYAALSVVPVPVLNREVVVVNRPPTAGNDNYVTNEDTALNVPSPGVLSNDGDLDGNPLSATLATNPAHGTVNLATNGSFIYTPNANYFGTDSFTYQVADGRGGTALGTVNIVVNSVNDPPVAVDDHYTIGGRPSSLFVGSGRSGQRQRRRRRCPSHDRSERHRERDPHLELGWIVQLHAQPRCSSVEPTHSFTRWTTGTAARQPRRPTSM